MPPTRVPETPGPGLTLPSLLLGLGLVVLISLGAPYSIWIVGSSEITWSFFPIGVGVPFVALVFLSALLRRLRPGWGLAPAELVTILVMGLVASGIPIFVAGYLLAIISKPYYGATPENEWAEYLQPYLPHWALPSPEHQAMRYFYEGLPAGHSLPLRAWLGPLGWWLSLILALYLVCFCLVVILRRQWVEHERLVFPLTEVPRLLIEPSPAHPLPATFRARTFWLGSALPLAIILFNAIAYFYPGFPQLPIHQDNTLQLLPGTTPLLLTLYFPVVGFMYLVGTSISFSVWFCYLFTLAESGVVSWAGLGVARPDAFVWDWQPLAWQAYGAFVAMVLWSLWMGRRHLAAVFGKAFGRRETPADQDELIPYRPAVYGLLGGILYILAWTWKAGMDLHVALLYLGGVLVMVIGITRLVVQSGLHYLTPPMASQGLAIALCGTAIPPPNLGALALAYSWCGDIESIFMPSAAHAAKLNELCPRKRSLALAIALAVVASLAITLYFMLYMCYKYGAGNFRSWFFQPGAGAGSVAFDWAVYQLRDPQPTDWGKLAYLGLGALVYSLLSLCQYRFHWWPLSPVGLTVATTWMVRRIALSVFLAWALKTLILRLGGVRAYRACRPFFVGLIVGFFVGVGISYGVDLIWFFGKGHPILHG
jgi:hypothetical protein